MTDFMKDFNTGSLMVVDGDLVLITDKKDLCRQAVVMTLNTFKGEWFLDTEYGIGYFQSILGHKVSKSSVDLIFQKEILSENGVKELTYFQSTFANRQYSLTFRVKVTTGDETDNITITL